MIYEELLYEEESSTLDFKSEQYPFNSASDYQKSELLKDILAFANAWRHGDAYILIGVREIKGGRSEVVGIVEELDDAQLQQFVNTKTQRPIDFEYKTILIDGKKVGSIRIPLQKRPIFLTKDYGKLKKHIVYIRRGSSTDEANPDEVAKMGHVDLFVETQPPILSLEFANIDDRVSLGKQLISDVTLLNISCPDNIPDYSDRKESGLFSISSFTMNQVNRDYYRELVVYYYVLFKTTKIGFVIKNSSDTIATDVKVEILVDIKPKKYGFFEFDRFPKLPQTHFNFLGNIKPISQQLWEIQIKPDITIDHLKDRWLIEVWFQKVQPKQTVFTKDIVYLATNETCNIELCSRIFADNLPNPIEERLKIDSKVKNQEGSLEVIKEIHRKNTSNNG